MRISMTAVRTQFDARARDLDAFEIFAGTGTPGEDGLPDLPSSADEEARTDGDPDTALALGALGSLGLAGASYGLWSYAEAAKPLAPLAPMKALYQKIQIGKALERTDSLERLVALMEVLPGGFGSTVKRLNIDALTREIGKVMEGLETQVNFGNAGIDAADRAFDRLEVAGKAGFFGFGALAGIGASTALVVAAMEDRAEPMADDAARSFDGMSAGATRKVEAAYAEYAARTTEAMGEVDALLAEVTAIADAMPDFGGVVGLFAQAEDAVEDVARLVRAVDPIGDAIEGFIDVVNVLNAPFDGLFTLFESPPKILPTIVGYETITPAIETPLGTIPAVTIPIPGFKELFPSIPRDEIQKIIDLIVRIAGVPADLLESALGPILAPLDKVVEGLMRPVIDALNPFGDFVPDFDALTGILQKVEAALGAIVGALDAAVDAVGDLDLDLAPVEEIGRLVTSGMRTYFGDDGREILRGAVQDAAESGAMGKSGEFAGAVLFGNGGDDKVVGTALGDVLGGGTGRDSIMARGGADVVTGGGGNDRIWLGAGFDVASGGGGADRVFGGTGNDEVNGNGGADLLKGGRGRDVLAGGNGRDRIEGDGGADRLEGDAGHDVLRGGGGRDALIGGGGRDRLFGQGGRDDLDGGAGRDLLRGGGGGDRIDGGAGDDRLVGDRGADTFVFEAGDGRDVVVDFDAGRDRIEVDGRYSVRDVDGGALLRHGDGDTVLFLDVDRQDLL